MTLRSWLCSSYDDSFTRYVLWRHSQTGAGECTLEALAGVALADVAGAAAVLLGEAPLAEVVQQQHPAAVHLLLTEGHLHMGKQGRLSCVAMEQ